MDLWTCFYGQDEVGLLGFMQVMKGKEASTWFLLSLRLLRLEV